LIRNSSCERDRELEFDEEQPTTPKEAMINAAKQAVWKNDRIEGSCYAASRRKQAAGHMPVSRLPQRNN